MRSGRVTTRGAVEESRFFCISAYIRPAGSIFSTHFSTPIREAARKMFSPSRYIALGLAALLSSVRADSVIVPGAAWTDTNGDVIQAHGAGILKVRRHRLSAERLSLSILTFSWTRSGARSTGSARTKLPIVRCLVLFRVIL